MWFYYSICEVNFFLQFPVPSEVCQSMVAGRTGLLFFIAAFYLACGAEADQEGGKDESLEVRELSKYFAIHKEIF